MAEDIDGAAAARANYVEGLKTERAMYVTAGRADRVKQVDAELARFDAAPKKRAPAKKSTTEG